ncbi:hypothetical protein BKA62DRAFT_785147 [Auriculariales sp. MPI-PUGE-AT-0066]|nr:hypothetical protein BKA62DRAFT_785147 [Auriculariales sp. MPI-PUGE-AT-0066]
MAVWCANLVPGAQVPSKPSPDTISRSSQDYPSKMVLHVGVTHDPKKESTFAAVQVVTSIPCGWLADTTGRKTVVQIGSFGVAIGTISFGFSNTYIHMLISRGLCGAMGGTWAAMRTMVSEGVAREHHGIAFAGLSLLYYQILSLPYRSNNRLPLGGFLAHPDRSIGGPFRSPFWAETYPFALPCVLGGVLALLALIVSQIYLHEVSGSETVIIKLR